LERFIFGVGMIRGTYIDNFFDTDPKGFETSWPELCDLLKDLSTVTRHPSEKQNCTPAIFPTVFRPGGTAKTVENVDCLGSWFGVDIDYHLGFHDLLRIMDVLGCPHVVHTTTRHRDHEPHLRALFEIDREVQVEEFPMVWASMNQMFGGVLDPQTKNINRLFICPARWSGSDARFEYRTDGIPLNVEWLLESFPAAVTDHSVMGTTEVNLKMDLLRQNLRADQWTLDFGSHEGHRFVSPTMVDQFKTASEGGRLYRLMVQIAIRALTFGYPITPYEIERLALSLDRMVTGKKRKGSLIEAQHALNWAFSVHNPDCHEARRARIFETNKNKKENTKWITRSYLRAG
jgi:hypothetical protein